MAGYLGTPLPRKLGIKGHDWAWSRLRRGIAAAIGPLPEGVEIADAGE